MIVKFILILILFSAAISSSLANRSSQYYGSGLCANDDMYHCIKIKRGDSWKKLFPDPAQRDIVQRINRTNTYLWRGKSIAVPHNLEHLTIFDVSPFPLQVEAQQQNSIIVDQDKLAWGAYNKTGQLIRWGPISSGKDYCRDIKKSCKTITGSFYAFQKKDRKCVSNIFPVNRGGAKMPYCMFFYRGYALHGSPDMPGYRDSHGCIRLFVDDAKWLNTEFIHLTTADNHFQGTKIVIKKLSTTKKKKTNGRKKKR